MAGQMADTGGKRYGDGWRVEKEVVQLPPERYVPKFYKWCTGLLLAFLVLAIGRLALKRWL